MATETVNMCGLKCPQPVIKASVLARKLPKGTTLVIEADCSTFDSDIRKWCQKQGVVLLTCTASSGVFKAQVQL